MLLFECESASKYLSSRPIDPKSKVDVIMWRIITGFTHVEAAEFKPQEDGIGIGKHYRKQ